MNQNDRITYFPLVVAVAFSLFAGSEIYQRAAIELTGMVVASKTSCRQPANNRCATVYVVSAADGARCTYIAGPVDHALVRRLPVGTVIRKLKWSLSYGVDGRTINDFPIGFYAGVIGASLVLAAWSLWRIGRRRLSGSEPWCSMSGEDSAGQPVVRGRLDPRAIVIMGVSGSGKSTLGRLLADALGRRFVEGDTLHPAVNREKMAAGIALDDEDRWPFFDRVAETITDAPPSTVVVACSALKRSYRDFIRARTGSLTFVLPWVERQELARRLAHRTGHFMPASLLDSQLATLEMPSAAEHAIVVDGTLDPEVQVSRVIAALQDSSRA